MRGLRSEALWDTSSWQNHFSLFFHPSTTTPAPISILRIAMCSAELAAFTEMLRLGVGRGWVHGVLNSDLSAFGQMDPVAVCLYCDDLRSPVAWQNCLVTAVINWMSEVVAREFGALAGSRGQSRAWQDTLGAADPGKFSWKAWDRELACYAPLTTLLLQQLVGLEQQGMFLAFCQSDSF
jgi:hypothetical protein